MALTDSLTAYFKLEESSGTRVDATGRGNDLSPTNSPGNTTGKLGSALAVAAANDTGGYASRADTADLSSTAAGFTVTCWAQKNGVTAPTGPLGKWNVSGAASEYAVLWLSSQWNFYAQNSSSTTTNAITTGSWSDNTWYFIVAGIDSADSKLFISVNNGTVFKSAAALSGGIRNGAQDFRIGRYHSGSANSFKGIVDEVGVWQRTLTAAEITQLYNAGAGLAYPFGAVADAAIQRPFSPALRGAFG